MPCAAPRLAATIAAASEAPAYLPANGADDVTEAWRCSDTPVFIVDLAESLDLTHSVS